MPDVLQLSSELQRPTSGRPGLRDLEAALAAVGNPQAELPSISLIGTNGKGSTATMLAAVLQAHGLAVGLFTSPHLVRIEECIQINGKRINEAALRRHLRSLEQARPGLPSFEALTGAAFLQMRDSRVDCAILETGLGAPWDATMSARPDLAGITNVGTDHSRWLGTTREEIAGTKGQAAARARRVVLGPGVDAAIEPHLGLSQVSRAADLVELIPEQVGTAPSWRVRWQRGECSVEPPLPGAHQVANLQLCLALAAAAQELGIAPRLEPDALIEGLGQVTFKGRLSRHRVGRRTVILDGAHNLESARSLAEHVRTWPSRPSLVFSCLDDKPVEAMARALRPVIAKVALCRLDGARAMRLDRMSRAFPGALVCEGPMEAIARLADPVVVAGSLRLVGAVLTQTGKEVTG